MANLDVILLVCLATSLYLIVLTSDRWFVLAGVFLLLVCLAVALYMAK